MPQKKGSTHHFFFFKCPVPSQENWHCYIIVRFCVLHFNVVFLLCCSSLLFDALPSVLVWNPDLFFFLNRFMNFEQRYTTVAFIYLPRITGTIWSQIKKSIFKTDAICGDDFLLSDSNNK